jgi:TolA-binding protein
MEIRAVLKTVVCVVLLAAAHPLAGQNTKENADFKLALNLYNDGLYDLASEQLRQFVTTYPATAQGIEARFYLGLTQLKLRQYDEARLTFQTFALTYQDNPKAPEAWMHAGESFAAIGNHREAALAYERVRVFHPRSEKAPEALVRASTHFTKAGEPESARRVLRVVLQEYGSSGSAMLARAQLGRIHFEDGNLEQAQQELRRVIEGSAPPQARAEALLVMGNIHRAIGRPDLARTNYNEIIAKHGTTGVVHEAYLNLGAVLADSGTHLQAIENFRKVMTPPPGVAADSGLVKLALLATADSYAQLNDYTNAIAHYERFITTFPADTLVHEALWRIALAAGKAREYHRSNDASTQLLKSDAPARLKRRALVKLATNAEEQNLPGTAARHYASFAEQFPDDPVADEVYLRLGRAAQKEPGGTRKAASAYETLIGRFPSSPHVDDAHAHAGECYEQLKDFDRALALYRALLQSFPASDLRDEVETRIRMIETFEAKEKDAGLEKLALLVGDVVAEKERVGLAFRLGEIYFTNLKNYAAAAAQFSTAVNSGLGDQRFVDALYLRARSYEFLSWKEERYTQQAIDAYRQFLQSYPAEARADEARLSLFTLLATSPTAAREAYAATIAVVPATRHRDEMLLRVGLMQAGTDNPATALPTLAQVAREFSGSPSAARALYEMTALHTRLGQADSALSSGQQYLRLYPRGPHAALVLATLGDLHLQRGNAAQALDMYRQLVNEYSYTRAAAGVLPKLADAYAATGAHDRAIALYADELRRQTGSPFREQGPDPSLLFALGRAHQVAGNNREAKKYLFEFLARERTGERPGQAYNLLGVIFRNEGATDIAASYFRQARAVAPGAAASREVANLLFDAGEYADAITQYTQLSQTADNEPDKRLFDSRIIIARLRSDDLANADKAITAFTTAYKRADDELAQFELERGNYYFRRADYQNARRSYDRVVDRYDKTASAPAAMYWIGKILEATNKPQDALRQYDRLLKAHPRSDVIPRVYLSLGNIHYQAERWDEATLNYRKVVEAPGPDPSILQVGMSNLIQTYDMAGAYDAALDLTRRYLERYPHSDDNFDKRVKIGILYDRLGYYDHAILHLQSLLDEAGGDVEGEIRYYLAEANFNKGDYQQAILEFLKVPYLVTRRGKIDWTANALYMSGQSYERMGRFDQALTMYQQIIDRQGIDETFKAAARKEIERVRLVLQRPSN